MGVSLQRVHVGHVKNCPWLILLSKNPCIVSNVMECLSRAGVWVDLGGNGVHQRNLQRLHILCGGMKSYLLKLISAEETQNEGMSCLCHSHAFE